MNSIHPEIPLADCHVHLCDPAFEQDLQDVLTRAGDSGIEALVAVGEDMNDARRNLRLAEANPRILPAAGLYPGNADLIKIKACFWRRLFSTG